MRGGFAEDEAHSGDAETSVFCCDVQDGWPATLPLIRLRSSCPFISVRKNRMLTLVIVVSLGIGIGANSAIFSVVDALLLRPLPYPHPDRLAAVWLHSPAIGILRDWPSPGE